MLICRRHLLRHAIVLLSASTVALLATPAMAQPGSGRSAAGSALLPRRIASASPAHSEEVNVWAATRGEIPERLRDIPPRVYVPHERGADVAVIDPTTMQIVDRFAVGRTRHHVAPSHNLSFLYVNVMDASRLVVIDARSGRPIDSVAVPVPYNLYFTPDGWPWWRPSTTTASTSTIPLPGSPSHE